MKEKDKTTLKITSQCREGSGMMYGLKCEGVILTLIISGRANDGDLGDWQYADAQEVEQEDPGQEEVEVGQSVGFFLRLK